MRLSYLTVFATVSLAALLSLASVSQAAPSPLHFKGTLKPQESWKVGIVNPKGTSFCAMVNKFDQHVGLAFALSPDGFGSVAIDLGKKAFEAGKDYTATLTTAGGHADKMQGHATSAQSLVIQIGQNDAFYDALSKKPELAIKLPVLDVSFALTRFSHGYRDLVDCSGALSKNMAKMPAVKVKDVEKQALAPIDQEVAKLAPVAKEPERKLLASVVDAEAVPEAKDSGAAARKWDAEQASKMAQIRTQEQARQAQYLKQAVADKDAQIAALKKEQSAKASQKLAAFKAQKKSFDERTANLQQQVAALEQANTAGATLASSAAAVAAKANIAAKEAELAKVKTESADKTRAVNIDLARAAMEYQKRLGGLETGRAAMQKKLAQATADLTDAHKTMAADKTRMAALQSQLNLSKQNQQGLQESLEKLKAQNLKVESAKADAQKELLNVRKSLVIVNDSVAAKAKQQKSQADVVEKQKEALSQAKENITALRKQNEQLSSRLARVTLEAPSSAPMKVKAVKPVVEVPVQQSVADAVQDTPALVAARAEIATLREKNAHLSESLNAVKVAPVQVAVAKAQAEIMKLKTQKMALQDKLEQKNAIETAQAHAPSITWNKDVPVKTAPVKMAAVQPQLNGYTNAYHTTMKNIQVRSAPIAAPKIALSQPTAAQALAASQVQPAAGDSRQSIDNADGSFNANKAEAFLDRIMSYHNIPVQAEKDVPAPKNHAHVFAMPETKAAAKPAPAPVHLHAPAQRLAPVMAAPVQQTRMQTRTPIPFNGGAEPVKLITLLHQSGLSGVRFSEAGGTNAAHLRQWTSGNLNGMAEQFPAADFAAAVQSYIDRYRQDCAGKLKTSIGAVQTVAAGKLQQASVSCPVSGNSYDTSFVFLQDAKTFTAILHTGYPADAARINNIGDNIAYMLGSSGGIDFAGAAMGHTASAGGQGGFVQSAPMQQLPLNNNDALRGMSGAPPIETQAPLQLHLNVPPLSSVGTHTMQSGHEGFKTVVVQ